MTDNNALSSTLGLLAHLSIDELKEVLNDDDRFENMTRDANIVAKDIKGSEKEMLIASNKSLADYNLSRSEEFQERKCKLIDLYQELKDINSIVEEKSAKLKELTSKSNTEVVLTLLQTATSEIEQETDDIAEKFLNSEMKIEEFLDKFPNKRKLMHLRKAKAEKMTELVNRRLSYKSPQTAALPTSRITTIMQNNVKNIYPNYSNAPVNVPYPLAPINMPLPSNYLPNHF